MGKRDGGRVRKRGRERERERKRERERAGKGKRGIDRANNERLEGERRRGRNGE